MPKQPTVKIPPQNIDAEASVLGACMLDNYAISKIVDIIQPDDFYHPQHQAIFEAFLELFERSEPIDIVTVSAILKKQKRIKQVGGSEYLANLISTVPTAAHVEHYAHIVKEKSVRRNLIQASSEINETAFDSENFDDLLDSVEKKIFSISERSRPQRFVALKTELASAYERIEKLHRGDGALRGVPSYFEDLDAKLSGFQKSDLIILGARPSAGKTSFALDIARNIAMHGGSVGIFSIEMSREQIIDRLIASQAKIPLWHLRTGKLKSESEFALVQQGLEDLSKANIFVDDTPSPTVLQMRSAARRLQLEHGIDILVIDYLQLAQPRTNNESTVQQITEISRGLKALARELNIPVLTLSQLSRDVEKRDIKIPRLSDLRDSGSIEQDADVVLFIHRKDRERIDVPPEEQNVTEIIIAKHRNGPIGSISLRFDPELVSFHTMEKNREEEF